LLAGPINAFARPIPRGLRKGGTREYAVDRELEWNARGEAATSASGGMTNKEHQPIQLISGLPKY